MNIMLLLIQALKRHHKFLKRSVTCSLPQTIYCYMGACGASNYSCNRICNGQSKIIMTVQTYGNRNVFSDGSNQERNEFWCSVTYCIGNIYSVCTCFSDCLEYFGQKSCVRPGRILCRKFNLQPMGFCIVNCLNRFLYNLFG